MPLHEVLELITAKKRLFCDYEALTQKLLDCPIEEIEALVIGRGELIAKVEEIHQRLSILCQKNTKQYPMLQAAIKNSCTYGELDAELQAVFARSQEVYGVINRVQNIDPLATSRMQSLKQEMLDAIAAANTNKDANLQRYLSNTALKNQSFSVFGDKYAKI